nr:o-succinylbenzoate synthase [Clostridia bacterium]
MKIDRIELYLVENEFRTPWRTAYGSDAYNSVLITRMVSGDQEGWSESSPLPSPTYCAEYGAGSFRVARDFLAPRLLGCDLASARELNARLADIKGNYFAKGGVEMAWWTLAAAREGKTLGQLIGAREGEIEIGQGFGICDSYDELIAKIGGAVDEGYS